MKAPADLTILLGPQTIATVAVNSVVRQARHRLSGAGILTLPGRLANPMLRRCLDGRPAEERKADFKKATAKRPAFLAAFNFFGPPHAGLAQRELFPNAELALSGLAELAPQAQLVVGIDPLPTFFLATGSAALEARVRATPWELLYELSWADLMREITELLPKANLLVLTTNGLGLAPSATLQRLFGKHSDLAAPNHALLRALINQTGHAVLDRFDQEAAADETMLQGLYRSFARHPDPAIFHERLGIDKVTTVLLNQRFDEDLEQIKKLPRTEVV